MDISSSHLKYETILSRKNVGCWASVGADRLVISRMEIRNYVEQFSVQILEADKILGYFLSFYVNRIERTHFYHPSWAFAKKRH